MTRRYKKIMISIFMILILTPYLQTKMGLLPELALSGVQEQPEMPVYSKGNYLSGQFQKNFEEWFSENFGLRSYYIKVNNQLKYSFFNKSTFENVIIGKEGYLYEPWYIFSYLKIFPREPKESSEIEEKVKNIKQIQDEYKKQNKVCLVLITPSKASIYPEYIPDKYSRENINKRSDYDNFIYFLDKYEVDYVDTHKIMNDEKNKKSYKLFPQSGTHWNRLGAFYATEKLIDKIEKISGQSLTNLRLASVKVDQNPVPPDTDLVKLLNLIITPNKFETPHPIIKKEQKGDEIKPDIIFQGGSFIGGIVETLNENEVFNHISYYFYAKKKLDFPERTTTEVDFDKIDWQEEILNKDILILETNEVNIYNMGSGFIERLKTNVCGDLNESEENNVFDASNYEVGEDPSNILKGAYRIASVNDNKQVWLNKIASIDIKPQEISDGINIKGWVPVSLHKKANEDLQEVKIAFYIYNQKVDEVNFKEDKEFDYIIKYEKFKHLIKGDSKDFTLKIEVSNSFNPQKSNLGNDTRDLSIILKYIRII